MWSPVARRVGDFAGSGSKAGDPNRVGIGRWWVVWRGKTGIAGHTDCGISVASVTGVVFGRIGSGEVWESGRRIWVCRRGVGLGCRAEWLRFLRFCWIPEMVRRKRPVAERLDSSRSFSDPAVWLPGFLSYLDAECGLAANTLSAYRRDLERFLEWNRVGVRAGIHEITVPVLTQFLEYQQTLQLSAPSIGRSLAAVRMFFRYLTLEGVVTESAADLVSSPKLWERLPKVLSPEMVDALLQSPQAAADRYPARDRALLALMYATGCRVSEIASMKLSDVNLGEGFCRCTGKGNKQRLVSLNPVAVSALRGWIETERLRLVQAFGQDQGWLFLSRSGRRVARESIWSLIRRYARRSGCGDISPHTLRHSFATHLLAGGADIRSLQEMLGHASIRTTQVYTHVEHSRLKAVHRKCHPRG